MKLKINKIVLLIFLSVIFYKIILDLSYYFVVSRAWDYFGYGIQTLWDFVGYKFVLNNIKIVESYILLIMILLLIPRSTKKISNILLWLLVLFAYVPMLTIYALKDGSRLYIWAITLFWILVFSLLKFVPQLRLLFFKKIQAQIIYYAIFLILNFVSIFLILKYIGLSFNLDFAKIYETRAAYGQLDIPFLEYLFNWLALMVNPVFLISFLKKKKWLYLIFVLLIQALLFSVTGNKIYLFVIPYAIFLAWLINRRHILVIAALTLAFIVILGMLSYFLIDDVWLTALFAHRTLFTPALLSFHYYDFFSQHQLLHFSTQRIFRNFIPYPYDIDPPHLISINYFNRPQMSSNNGIWADAYMNFGFIGLIIWAILLVIFLKIVDSFAQKKDKSLALAAVGASVILFTNTPFFTAFLTGGLLLGLAILYLLPQHKSISDINTPHHVS